MNPLPLTDLLNAVETAQTTYNNDVNAQSAAAQKVAADQANLAQITANVQTDASGLNAAIDAAIAGLSAAKIPVPLVDGGTGTGAAVSAAIK